MMKLEKFKEKKNKKKGIIIFTISCILLIAGVFFYQSFALFETKENFNFIKGQVQDPGDLYFAYYVEDVLTYDMPSKDSGYTMSSKSNCSNGVIIEWDDEKWMAKVYYENYQKENNSRVKCTLYFEEKVIPPSPSDAVKDYIIAKAPEGTLIEDDGTEDHNMRYIGASPNNYIDIGDRYTSDIYYGYYSSASSAYQIYSSISECTNAKSYNVNCKKMYSNGDPILWRIIGVMNNIDNGSGKKETRLKIIRKDFIGYFSWDTSDSTINGGRGINEWSQADVMKLLNPGHDSESIGGSLYWNRGSGTCSKGLNNATTACDFTTAGLKETAKSMIGEAVWNTGANGTEYLYTKILTSRFYELERSTNTGKICTSGDYCNDAVERTTTWTGYIGLMYPSDYGFATSGGSTTSRETCLNTILSNWFNSNVSDCASNDWLYKSKTNQWTLSPSSDSSCAVGVFFVYNNGSGQGLDAYYAYALSPALYLNANVKIVNGEGTSSSPFILSQD